MMMNPETEYEQHQRRRGELMRQAKIQSLIQQAQADTPGIQQRLLLLLSDLMINSGTRLRRYADGARDVRRARNRLQTNDYGLEWMPRR